MVLKLVWMLLNDTRDVSADCRLLESQYGNKKVSGQHLRGKFRGSAAKVASTRDLRPPPLLISCVCRYEKNCQPATVFMKDNIRGMMMENFQNRTNQ